MKCAAFTLIVAMIGATSGRAAAKDPSRAERLSSAVHAACRALTTPPLDAQRIAAQFGVVQSRRADGLVIRPFESGFAMATVKGSPTALVWKVELILAHDPGLPLSDLEKLLGIAKPADDEIYISRPKWMNESSSSNTPASPEHPRTVEPTAKSDRSPVASLSPEADRRRNAVMHFARLAGAAEPGCQLRAAVVRSSGDLHQSSVVSVSITQ
jgi:hypothetical protein